MCVTSLSLPEDFVDLSVSPNSSEKASIMCERQLVANCPSVQLCVNYI